MRDRIQRTSGGELPIITIATDRLCGNGSLAPRGRRLLNQHELLFLLLKAPPAEYRPVLCGLERDCGLRPALGAGCASLLMSRLVTSRTLGSALLAALRIVSKLPLLEEQLFARREDEISATFYAFENSVSEFHDSRLHLR